MGTTQYKEVADDRDRRFQCWNCEHGCATQIEVKPPGFTRKRVTEDVVECRQGPTFVLKKLSDWCSQCSPRDVPEGTLIRHVEREPELLHISADRYAPRQERLIDQTVQLLGRIDAAHGTRAISKYTVADNNCIHVIETTLEDAGILAPREVARENEDG